MPRIPVSMTIADVSAFARSLARALPRDGAPPGHLAMLNLLARAAGHGNWQALRAASARASAPAGTPAGVTAPPPAADAASLRRIDRARRLFDAEGRLTRWPSRAAIQDLCLWVMWSRLPARTALSERAVNALFDGWQVFGDRAVLRRGLIDAGLARRNPDGSDYRRVEREPPPEARSLIAMLGR